MMHWSICMDGDGCVRAMIVNNYNFKVYNLIFFMCAESGDFQNWSFHIVKLRLFC